MSGQGMGGQGAGGGGSLGRGSMCQGALCKLTAGEESVGAGLGAPRGLKLSLEETEDLKRA